MEMLEELTYLYSVKSLLNKLAIEYYESIENPRFRDYQNKLNLLLTQPDIIKKMGNPIYRNKNSNSIFNYRSVKNTRLREKEKD